MKSLLPLLDQVLLDMEDWCCVSTTLDRKTIYRRVEHEGISFLTISLPNFGKDFEKSLDQGFVSDDLFLGFKKRGGLPVFLQGFLQNVFEPVSARLLDEPCIESIRCIRQFCGMFGKIELDCSPSRVHQAFAKYVECEQEVRLADLSFSIQEEDFVRVGKLLFSGLFSHVDGLVFNQSIMPKHGPGSVQNRLTSNAKWRDKHWTVRLENKFPRDWYLFSSEVNAYFSDELPSLLEPGAEPPVRVITVPKTLKTPRIIAVEPSWMMFVQQGLSSALYEYIDRDDILSMYISNKDQVPNQVLAREGSLTGNFATLDLSEASDRVSNQHVRALLANHPHLFEAVDACRSRKADVPGFPVQRLAKFASMGSALCFPFESMVFLTIVFLGIEDVLNRRVTLRDLNRYRGLVRVYGDDIIVPVHFADSVNSRLESFGFRVNRSKSFWTGKFRESCGKEYYEGEDVSIFKLRRVLPTSRKHAPEIISASSFRNQAFMFGFWRTAAYMDRLLGKLIPYPRVGPRSQAIGRHTFLPIYGERMCPNLHKPLVRAFVESTVPPKDPLDGADALLKIFTIGMGSPGPREDHLERAGRPWIVNIKSRWASAL